MNVYIDIELLFSNYNYNFLWTKVYQKIHLGLVEMQIVDGISNIGVAFPEYNIEKQQLGSKLRLFSDTRWILENFNVQKRLKCLLNFINIKSIQNVPGNVIEYKCYKRWQPKPGTERLARRKAKRSGVEFEEILKQLDSRKVIFLKLPFINISSDSTKQNFRLFILEEKWKKQIIQGFSCYGLSSKSTVPDF